MLRFMIPQISFIVFFLFTYIATCKAQNIVLNEVYNPNNLICWNNRLVVSDNADEMYPIKVFNSEGKLIHRFSSGYGPNEFIPHKAQVFSIDKFGRLFIWDRERARLSIFDADFNLINSISDPVFKNTFSVVSMNDTSLFATKSDQSLFETIYFSKDFRLQHIASIQPNIVPETKELTNIVLRQKIKILMVGNRLFFTSFFSSDFFEILDGNQIKVFREQNYDIDIPNSGEKDFHTWPREGSYEHGVIGTPLAFGSKIYCLIGGKSMGLWEQITHSSNFDELIEKYKYTSNLMIFDTESNSFHYQKLDLNIRELVLLNDNLYGMIYTNDSYNLVLLSV